MTKPKAAPATPQRAALMCPRKKLVTKTPVAKACVIATSVTKPSLAKASVTKPSVTKMPPIANLKLAHIPDLAPAVLADIRRDYEAGEEPLIEIAARHGLKRPMLSRIAVAQGWRLRMTMPTCFPSHGRKRKKGGTRSPPPSDDPAAPEPARGWNKSDSATKAKPATIAALALRLHRALAREIDRIERLHQASGEDDNAPRGKSDDARTVRTLTALTETLFKVKQLRAQDSAPTDNHDNDIGDIDQFLTWGAQRIDALVAGEPGAAVPEQPRCEGADAASS